MTVLTYQSLFVPRSVMISRHEPKERSPRESGQSRPNLGQTKSTNRGYVLNKAEVTAIPIAKTRCPGKAGHCHYHQSLCSVLASSYHTHISPLYLSHNMAAELPIIAPTRSATPPPEGYNDPVNGLGLDGYLNSPVKSAFDPHSLSPMDENFPIGRYGSAHAYSAQPLNPLSPSNTNSLHYMRSTSSIISPNTMITDDNKGAFNFQSVSLAKSPVTKSVSSYASPIGRYFS